MGTGNSSASSSGSSPAAVLARKIRGGSSAEDGARPSQRSSSASGAATGGAGSYVRRAHHSGSWYESSQSDLNRTLGTYLSDASADERTGRQQSSAEEQRRTTAGAPAAAAAEAPAAGPPRAIVSPHAGYSYSGPTAAYAYLALGEALRRWLSSRDGDGPSASGSSGGGSGTTFTVVVLHPSHHVYLNGCAISGASMIETPLVNLRIDDTLRSDLLRTGNFTLMDRRTDESEHSGEMQYPYIARMIEDAAATSSSRAASDDSVRVLPIMVGALSTSSEKKYGQILAPHLSRPNVFTVISSDFCHWGRRFGYTPTQSSARPDGDSAPFNDISTYIEWLDRQGMSEIELQRPGAFAAYLKTYSNTICGRHPIGVWLNSVSANRDGKVEILDVRFVRYAQSGRVTNLGDSSVSYASAVARLR